MMMIRECIITPDVATKLLNKNTNNRRLSSRRVDCMVKSMQRGEWQFNGDTIRISKTGRLLDGQHRLSAIERSGIPQKYIIVEGLDDDSFKTIDTGSSRDAAQMIGMTGAKNATSLAAAARMALLWYKEGRPIHTTLDKNPTHSQIIEFVDGNTRLVLSASFATQKWTSRYIGPAITTFCHYAMGLENESIRDLFFDEMINGEFSYNNSPLRYLRDLLIEERGNPGSPDRLRRIALIFKAFRLYREKKPMKIIRLASDINEWFIL